jgi:hypothetical protein
VPLHLLTREPVRTICKPPLGIQSTRLLHVAQWVLFALLAICLPLTGYHQKPSRIVFWRRGNGEMEMLKAFYIDGTLKGK